MAQMSIELSVFEKGRRAPKYELQNDINGEVTIQDFLEYSRKVIISVAKDALHDEQSRGFDKNPTVRVDNRYGRSEEAVKPLGQIEYIARQDAKEMLIFCYEAILERSRIVTGQYLRSNIVVFNGKEVARDMAGFKAWLGNVKSFNDRDRVRFVNIAPYANKLELDGVTRSGKNTVKVPKTDKKGRPKPGAGMRKPNGAYTIALRSIRNRYKGNSVIKYEQVLGSEMGLTSPERGSGVGRIRQTGKSKGRTYVYPSILVYVVEAGIIQ